VAERCTTCSSRSRRPVQKLSETPSYVFGVTVLEAAFIIILYYSCTGLQTREVSLQPGYY